MLQIERVMDQVLADSFPASDSPPWTLGVALTDPAGGALRAPSVDAAEAILEGTLISINAGGGVSCECGCSRVVLPFGDFDHWTSSGARRAACWRSICLAHRIWLQLKWSVLLIYPTKARRLNDSSFQLSL